MSKVTPVLKRMHSPDVFDLESYSPEDPDCFCFLLQAMFGPVDGEGEESFDIIVCTPKWLQQTVDRKGTVAGRHHIIMRSYDFEKLRTFLVDYAKNCTGKTWEEVAQKLSRLGKWEFEDYVP